MQIKRIELNLNTLTPFMQQVNHIYSGVCLRKKEEIDKQVGSCFENKIHNVIFLLNDGYITSKSLTFSPINGFIIKTRPTSFPFVD